MNKECSKCNIIKPVEDFSTGRNVCKKCRNEQQRKRQQEYRKNNKEKIQQYQKQYRENNKNKILQNCRFWQLKAKFGISQEDFDKMLKDQNFSCAICFSKDVGWAKNNKNFCVDHDHKTGKIRGLLCNRCNITIGSFEDNIIYLKNAIKYLKKYE